jgi:5-methylcytosine-specific restriction endonuclease McrA
MAEKSVVCACGAGIRVPIRGPTAASCLSCRRTQRNQGKRERLASKPKTKVVACLNCGGRFECQHKRKHCSPSCRTSFDRKLHAARLPSMMCSGCGTAYRPKERKTGRLNYCSPACAKRSRYSPTRSESKRRLSRLYNGHEHRARRFGVPYEHVNPTRVFERDGWACRMCGRATPPEKRGLCEPDSPELDHVIPLSRGGAHSYANTQCSCRACNSAKRDLLPEEMRAAA